jgi:hypothetical protein
VEVSQAVRDVQLLPLASGNEWPGHWQNRCSAGAAIEISILSCVMEFICRYNIGIAKFQ